MDNFKKNKIAKFLKLKKLGKKKKKTMAISQVIIN
jgi:hypothetical protein